MAGNAPLTLKHVASTYQRLPPLPSIRDIVRLYKIRATKKLSQNFLMDTKLASKIVSRGNRVKDCHVCEVGPGPGGITRAILEQKAAHVTVIEKDSRFLPTLELLKDACGGRLHIVVGDVLSFNMEKSFPSEIAAQSWSDRVPNIRIVGNLPFNVSTPLIIRWLRDISLQKSAWAYGRVPMTLTFQHEVAQRMVAFPGSEERCRLSVMCQNWCEVQHKFSIPGRAFIPKPDVDVGIVTFVPRIQPEIPLEFKLVEKVVRCLFSYRQKYCRRGAENLFPPNIRKELTNKMFTVADVNPTMKPFRLNMSEINRLCHAYEAIIEQNPRLARFNVNDEKTFDEEDNCSDLDVCDITESL